jgi:tRNA modification GTPase
MKGRRSRNPKPSLVEPVVAVNMPFYLEDTIAARATPAGRGGIGIIRISGESSSKIAETLLGKIPIPRYATFCDFLHSDGSVIDQGLALFFKAPHSFTGEDVLELQGHGGPIVLDMLLQQVLQLGVRLARPGEFSERAFLNNKIDLAQAEAIADLIEAESTEAARSAIKSLQGAFSQEVRRLVNKVIYLRTFVEAAIDFPEEEVDFLSDGKIEVLLKELITQVENVLSQAKQGATLKEGMKIVIIGHPNVGKSSLLNVLSGFETAIVSHIPGTTRDIVKEIILLDGMPLSLLDTAGLRETQDLIELEGVKRALNEIPNADRILLIVDAVEYPKNKLGQHPLVAQFFKQRDRLTIIRNKVDLTGEEAVSEELEDSAIPVINLSAKSEVGIPLLKQHLKECIGYRGGDTMYTARSRHLELLRKALTHFHQAMEQLIIYRALELVAQELWEAQYRLSEITGEFRAGDLLSQIFSSFCIGK